MNRFGKSTLGGSSKATASTLCQKCLKRDIFECKAVAQERPYVSRPSRTQQLLNPKLLPKLSSDAPPDLLRKKGIADEQLAKIEKERGRKRERIEDEAEIEQEQKRQRSASSSSSASVATISTKASRSTQSDREKIPNSKGVSMAASERKRRRSVSSEGFFPSDIETNRARADVGNTRSTRRKINDQSPLRRGRRRSRTNSQDQRSSHASDQLLEERNMPKKKTEYGNGRETRPYDDGRPTKSQSRSPIRRGWRTSPVESDTRHYSFRNDSPSPHRRSRRMRSRSPSEGNRTRVFTADTTKYRRGRSISIDSLGRRRYSDVDERYGMSLNTNDTLARTVSQERHANRAPNREKSLSPFSKRMALTQAMNMGR